MTDSGRTVYGGGGITPDVKIPNPKTNKFQDTLLEKYAFFNFAKHYVINHKVDKDFEVDDAVMQEFRKFLDEQKIPFTEADLAQNNDWMRSNIKAELFINEFGQQEGMRVHAETGSGSAEGTGASAPGQAAGGQCQEDHRPAQQRALDRLPAKRGAGQQPVGLFQPSTTYQARFGGLFLCASRRSRESVCHPYRL